MHSNSVDRPQGLNTANGLSVSAAESQAAGAGMCEQRKSDTLGERLDARIKHHQTEATRVGNLKASLSPEALKSDADDFIRSIGTRGLY